MPVVRSVPPIAHVSCINHRGIGTAIDVTRIAGEVSWFVQERAFEVEVAAVRVVRTLVPRHVPVDPDVLLGHLKAEKSAWSAMTRQYADVSVPLDRAMSSTATIELPAVGVGLAE